MQEVYEFLKEAKTYYLATVEGDQPRVRPFGTVDIFEGNKEIVTVDAILDFIGNKKTFE